MASAAILRSAARRLRQPLGQQQQARHVIEYPSPSTRRLSSSVPTELRSACRALGRPSSFSPAVENIIPRQRLYYSSGGRVIKADATLQKTITQLDRITQKADKLNELHDRTLQSLEELKQMIREKIERDRRKKMLVRRAMTSTFVGAAIFTMMHFFGKGQDKGQEDS